MIAVPHAQVACVSPHFIEGSLYCSAPGDLGIPLGSDRQQSPRVARWSLGFDQSDRRTGAAEQFLVIIAFQDVVCQGWKPQAVDLGDTELQRDSRTTLGCSVI